jgi:hypothetical protein
LRAIGRENQAEKLDIKLAKLSELRKRRENNG